MAQVTDYDDSLHI